MQISLVKSCFSYLFLQVGMSEIVDDSSTKGIKLPYFHRTLSPEDTALIGDITPKPISVSASDSSSIGGTSGKLGVGSAWNAANTWEERDSTAWAKQKLAEVFSSKFELPKTNNYTISFSAVDTFTGNAQVTHVRGTARYMYEFAFDLKVTVTSESGAKYKGKVAVCDVINDQLDDMEFALSWTTGKAPPNAELSAVRDTILKGKALKTAIKTKINEFEAAFRSV